jgi:hypothetical protein
VSALCVAGHAPELTINGTAFTVANDPAGVWSVAPVLVVPDGRSWIYGFGRRLNDLYLATEVE